MSSQQNITTVRRLFDEFYSKPNSLERLPEFFSESVKIHDPAFKSVQNLQGYKAAQKKYEVAFPDRKAVVDSIYAADDHVIVHWTITATHKGKLDDIDATNKKIKVVGIAIYRLTNGKITEVHQVWDRLGLLEQLGEIQAATALHA